MTESYFLSIAGTFFQARFSDNVPSETVSKINLVDLAGRFVEGYKVFVNAPLMRDDLWTS